jgi:hypothetical protein
MYTYIYIYIYVYIYSGEKASLSSLGPDGFDDGGMYICIYIHICIYTSLSFHTYMYI